MVALLVMATWPLLARAYTALRSPWVVPPLMLMVIRPVVVCVVIPIAAEPVPVTLFAAVTVTLPLPKVTALIPKYPEIVPDRSTRTLPALLLPGIVALIPRPGVVVLPVPPTCTPALVPGALFCWVAKMPAPLALTMSPLPSTVTAPVPALLASMPVAVALTLALAVTWIVPALAAFWAFASVPRVVPPGAPPITPPGVA